MLDRFVIFTKGGLVLFSKDFVPLKFNAVNTLVSDVLIEERAGKSSYISKEYAMKWTMLNELDVIFVAVYQKLFQLVYVDDFLSAIKNVFMRIYKKNGSSFLYSFHSFRSFSFCLCIFIVSSPSFSSLYLSSTYIQFHSSLFLFIFAMSSFKIDGSSEINCKMSKRISFIPVAESCKNPQ